MGEKGTSARNGDPRLSERSARNPGTSAVGASHASDAGVVDDVLRAADIPVQRRGANRLARLSQGERQLYRWIIERFAAASPPDAKAVFVAAVEHGVDAADALATFEQEDLVHLDADGAPLVAYPFSAVDRGHHVRIDGNYSAEAMCAIDALGIASMLDLPVEVDSHDPVSGTAITVWVAPDGRAEWTPIGAVVLAGSHLCGGPSFCSCCDVLNFFESRKNAESYLQDHPEITGSSTSIRDAIDVGRAVFGDILNKSDADADRASAN